MKKDVLKRRQDTNLFLSMLYEETVGKNDRNRHISIRSLSQELGFYTHPNDDEKLSDEQKEALEMDGRYAQEIVLSLRDDYRALTLIGHPNPCYDDGGEVQITSQGIRKVEYEFIKGSSDEGDASIYDSLIDGKSNRELRQKIAKYFNIDELRTLAFDLDIDWEELAGETKSIKIIEMIKSCYRQDRFEELKSYLQKDKPDVDWLPPRPTMQVRIKFKYNARGVTLEGKTIENSGSIDSQNFFDGDYYDEGFAYSEAMQAVVDHFYTHNEKEVLFGESLDKLSVELHDLKIEFIS